MNGSTELYLTSSWLRVQQSVEYHRTYRLPIYYFIVYIASWKFVTNLLVHIEWKLCWVLKYRDTYNTQVLILHICGRDDVEHWLNLVSLSLGTQGDWFKPSVTVRWVEVTCITSRPGFCALAVKFSRSAKGPVEQPGALGHGTVMMYRGAGSPESPLFWELT